MQNAIDREKQLKNWHHEWKWNLIKEDNSNSYLYDLYLGNNFFQINSEHINYFEKLNVIETPHFILNRYQIDKDQLIPVSLSSHQMCTYDERSLKKAFKNENTRVEFLFDLYNEYTAALLNYKKSKK